VYRIVQSVQPDARDAVSMCSFLVLESPLAT